jgi:hypothetical protein
VTFILELFANPWAIALWSLFCGLVGGLIGHWLSLGRDRRKERNAAAQTVTATLMRTRRLDPIEADHFMQLLPRRERTRFLRAAERHQKAAEPLQGYDPVTDTVAGQDGWNAELSASIADLLRCARQRR